jgi:transposase
MSEKYGENWVLFQDNAKPHTSRFTKSWLQDKNIEILPWPPYSPDLNPIENLWVIMKNRLEKENCKNIQVLEKKIREIWDEVTISTLKNLINSVPTGIEQCIQKNGEKTDY